MSVILIARCLFDLSRGCSPYLSVVIDMRKEGVGCLIQRLLSFRVGIGIVIDEIFVEADLPEQTGPLRFFNLLSEVR